MVRRICQIVMATNILWPPTLAFIGQQIPLTQSNLGLTQNYLGKFVVHSEQ
jgi:hypothetical protein